MPRTNAGGRKKSTKTRAVAGTTVVSRIKTNPGENETAKPVTERVRIERFVTEPAKVGIQQAISVETRDGEWRGFRVYIERPCYKEEIAATVRQVEQESAHLLERYREILAQESTESLLAQSEASYR